MSALHEPKRVGRGGVLSPKEISVMSRSPWYSQEVATVVPTSLVAGPGDEDEWDEDEWDEDEWDEDDDDDWEDDDDEELDEDEDDDDLFG